MQTYARIQNDVVAEIIGPLTDEDGNEIPIAERFTPQVVITLVDITDLDPQPQQWWTYDGTNFAPPAVETAAE